jgi:glycosyltransferase involved in cell wall biosynthesis
VLIAQLLPRAVEQWSTVVNVVHLDVRNTLPGAIAGMARAARVLRKFRPDILHCHNFHGNVLGGLLKPSLPGVAVISTIHNVYEGGWMRMGAYRFTDRLSERTVAACEAAAARMIEVGAVPRHKSTVIANGIDPGEFAPDPQRRQTMRSQMGVNDAFIWMTAGRVAPAKDYENLLRAFAEVRSTEGW